MPSSNKHEISQRRELISRLYLEGWYQSKIAEVTKCTQQQVSKDLAVLRRAWQINAQKNTDKLISKELAKIDYTESEAWSAWNESKKDFKETTTKKKTGPDDKEIKGTGEIIVKDVHIIGDPRFLAIVDNCIQRRCKILGFDAPEKHDNSTTLTIDKDTMDFLKKLDDKLK